MAELLIRVVDRVGNDLYQNTKCTKRGDVIAVQPDGWPWGREELRNPQWRILSIPEMRVDEAAAFMTDEKPIDPDDKRQTLLCRLFYLDIDNPALPEDFKTYIADSSRARPIYRLSLPIDQIRALKKKRKRVADPMFPDVIV